MKNRNITRPECFLARSFSLQQSKNFGWNGGKIQIRKKRSLRNLQENHSFNNERKLLDTITLTRTLQGNESQSEIKLKEWNWFDIEF
jgi:hypothetical protein